MSVRVRRDVWRLADWDPILLWYARAVTDMQRRPLNEPTSWRYQAAIHEYDRADDPNARPGETLPTTADQRRFWTQCQHSSWFFLPWHRMYLLYFERVVAATVARLGGPSDWSLPYWNYSDENNPSARILPPAFRAEATPDGVPNPLRVVDRNDEANAGDAIAGDAEVDIVRCLSEPRFMAQPLGGNPGFGGPRTLFNHGGGPFGKLEGTPHGTMHVAVGGWMGAFATAGLDPLFWLHHANIDRLWSVWRGNAAHANPTDAQWLTGVRFEFHDADGTVIAHTSSQVVDTSVEPFGYRYEDESDPLGGGVRVRDSAERAGMERDSIPEMVGATEGPVALLKEPTTTRFSVNRPTGPARVSEASGVPPAAYLNVENVTGTDSSTTYAVYLNLPQGADLQQHEDRFAGLLPMFGIREASRSDGTHPGSGLHFALDVGDIIRKLQARNEWDPADLRVTFVPRETGRRSERAPRAVEPIQIGRVSLYYS